ncbi:Uncharacterized conserved protein [Leminorella richardii]|uniref:Uncharacterized conserved protein n=1 Tax=Leminorella richardii TaxID=158841 RepID=A0A2X4U235_9GAMM|nr:PAAR domain-containing protein [Leminorella richardii]SQI33877.1 Uncharacterized conserved protein [Leminorella richardii]
MSNGLIRLGDRTSHGGEVITATSTIIIDGKAVARVGDLVSCPREGHGVNSIVEGSPVWMTGGKFVAVDGCRAACGCVLITSLPQITVS